MYVWFPGVQIWDLRTGSVSDVLKFDHPVTSLQFDTRKIIAATGENGIKVRKERRKKKTPHKQTYILVSIPLCLFLSVSFLFFWFEIVRAVTLQAGYIYIYRLRKFPVPALRSICHVELTRFPLFFFSPFYSRPGCVFVIT